MGCANLEPCVALVFASLAAPALRGFSSALQTQRALIEQKILKKQAQLLEYDIITAQVAAEQAIVNAALDAAERGLSSFPTNTARLVAECADLGQAFVAPEEALAVIRALANSFLNKLREITSFSEELGQAVQRLRELSQLIQDMVDCLTEITVQKEAPPVAA